MLQPGHQTSNAPARCNGSFFDVVLGRGSIATVQLELKTNGSTVTMDLTCCHSRWNHSTGYISHPASELLGPSSNLATRPELSIPTHKFDPWTNKMIITIIQTFRTSPQQIVAQLVPCKAATSLHISPNWMASLWNQRSASLSFLQDDPVHHLQRRRPMPHNLTFFMDLGLGLSWTKPTSKVATSAILIPSSAMVATDWSHQLRCKHCGKVVARSVLDDMQLKLH